MNDSVQSEYDNVAYPSGLFPQTHPDRLATVAGLFGLEPAPVEKCRVLELGCGTGVNVTAMGFLLPESRFTGIDLAKDPIRRGNETIAELGLKNVTLRQMDVMQFPDDLGPFDYIIAHGVYSWVPAEVREKIMAVCQKCLSEQGVAYISYNAHPGNHLRDLVRWMMKFHSQQFEDPAEKFRQSKALVKFAAEAVTKPGLWQDILKRQGERLERYSVESFYHDDLGSINQPFYFMEFMEHASRHGLQYLAEADIAMMLDDGLEKSATDMLRQFSTDAFIVREQYLDFIRGCSFRQTLLCRKELRPGRALLSGRVVNLHVASDLRPVQAELDVTTSGPADFKRPSGAEIATGSPVAKAALMHLGTIFPLSIPFAELFDIARGRLGKNSGTDGAEAERERMELAEFFARTHAMEMAELHSMPPQFVTQVSERPVASRLARLEIRKGRWVSTLRHRSLRIDDALGRHLLGLLDGTRDHAALATELTTAIRSGAVPPPDAAGGDAQTGEPAEIQPDDVRKNLQGLANSGLLEA